MGQKVEPGALVEGSSGEVCRAASARNPGPCCSTSPLTFSGSGPGLSRVDWNRGGSIYLIPEHSGHFAKVTLFEYVTQPSANQPRRPPFSHTGEHQLSTTQQSQLCWANEPNGPTAICRLPSSCPPSPSSRHDCESCPAGSSSARGYPKCISFWGFEVQL